MLDVKGNVLVMPKQKEISPNGNGLNLLRTEEASRFLRIPKSTLQNWRKAYWKKRYGFTGPTYVRIGRHILYRLADLQNFIERGVVYL